jgi:hypothetical protein
MAARLTAALSLVGLTSALLDRGGVNLFTLDERELFSHIATNPKRPQNLYMLNSPRPHAPLSYLLLPQ